MRLSRKKCVKWGVDTYHSSQNRAEYPRNLAVSVTIRTFAVGNLKKE